ncbi:MAG TPA: glucose-6-phosphate isomerase [Deltaproteobacteria bacterium]|nr:glucose-6-phosphate isomerase [Deltaproteobacteria bacterium]HQI81166.1 glucose-6-phosphate isomerase [Deltaproteobacteria bacterium]
MTTMEISLGPYLEAFEKTLGRMGRDRVVDRIREMDHTVWKINPREITDRLGWLFSPSRMRERVPELKAFASEIQAAGYTHALLLGMGGSSLAPEVLARTFGTGQGPCSLRVLDSTDPAEVAGKTQDLDPARTLFIVSTKSGTTVETLSFFSHCYRLCTSALGSQQAGEHFVAITDPDNPLNETARRCSFRRVFAGEPTIGGRFSALSVFGMVPGALIGMDVARLIDRALAMTEACFDPDVSRQGPNLGAQLGAALGVLCRTGRNKATFFLSPGISSFGDWVEQLVAESTGKEGTGILPVIAETPAAADRYANDRVFISIGLRGEQAPAPDLGKLRDAHHPVIRIFLDDPYDLGGQFFLWEHATAVAGHVLAINPFDQPDVEATKRYTREAVARYLETGHLGEESPVVVAPGIAVYAKLQALSLREVMNAFLSEARQDSYVGIQAYLPRTPQIHDALQALRLRVRDGYRVATTLGYGPRFLHSTGQLHKGDSGKGLFIQFTCESPRDIAIPDGPLASTSSMSFATLKAAQALGDAAALAAAGRPVLRIHITQEDIATAIRMVRSALSPE